MASFLMRAQPWTVSTPQNQLAKTSDTSSPSRSHSYPIQRKIHPDLSSLIVETSHDQHQEIPDIPKSATHATHTSIPDFVSLTSRSLKRNTTIPKHDDSIIQDTSRQQNQSVSSSGNSSGTERNLSGDTFGQRKTFESRTPFKKTPSPKKSQQIEDESQRFSSKSTPRSFSDTSQSEQSRQTEASSRNTFGIPSPGLNLLSQHKSRASTEAQPPMPPLNHPAFHLTSFNRQADNNYEERNSMPSGYETRRLNTTRHSRSLPTLTQAGRSLSKRRRAKTQSKITPFDFYLEAKSSTPASHRKTHKRSQSNASRSSSRRASAEFSAERASLASHNSDSSATWEAQVSREMVRLSLGGNLNEARRSEAKHMAASKSGQARGDHLVGASALGPPFLLQNALSPTAHCYNTPYTFTFGNDRQRLKRSAMSRTSSHQSPKANSRSPERTRTPSPKPKIKTTSSLTSRGETASHLIPPALSLTAATPDASPITPISPPTKQIPAKAPESVLHVPKTPSTEKLASAKNNGKRKADEAGVEGGGTPPKENKEPRATFAADPRPHRISANSNSTRSAPSSYHRKRARLSTTPESRPGSRQSSDIQNAATVGSWSSKNSSSHPPSQQHHNPRAPLPTHQPPPRPPSRQSLSQASIPMSALISPHAPSISRSSMFHMRDPRRPSPIHSTPWSLSFPSGRAGENEDWRGWMDRGGSPPHAWIFFLGFVVFPLWWVASFWRIPTTRRLDAGEQEKGVILDDPQVEHDAKSWRVRCRVMAVVSFFTYIPFVILVAVFA